MRVVILTNDIVSELLINRLKEAGEELFIINEKIDLNKLEILDPSLIITYGYDCLITEDIINAFGNSLINLHHSYLPWNRGMNADIWALIDNTPKGVTIHKIDMGINSGDILVQEEIVFDDSTDTLASVKARLQQAMLDMFNVNWKYLKEKRIIPTKQKKGGSVHKSADLNKYRRIIEKASHLPIKEFRRLCMEVK